MMSDKLDKLVGNSELSSLIIQALLDEAEGEFREAAQRYRDLVFNLRSNNELLQNVCEGSITPSKLVLMTPDEMATSDLRKVREQVAAARKHDVVTDKSVVGFQAPDDVARYAAATHSEAIPTDLESFENEISVVLADPESEDEDIEHRVETSVPVAEETSISDDESGDFTPQSDEDITPALPSRSPSSSPSPPPVKKQKSLPSRSTPHKEIPKDIEEKLTNALTVARAISLPISPIWSGSIEVPDADIFNLGVSVFQRGGIPIPGIPVSTDKLVFKNQIQFQKLKPFVNTIYEAEKKGGNRKMTLIEVLPKDASAELINSVKSFISATLDKHLRALVYKVENTDTTVYLIPGKPENVFPNVYINAVFGVERPRSDLWGFVMYGVKGIVKVYDDFTPDHTSSPLPSAMPSNLLRGYASPPPGPQSYPGQPAPLDDQPIPLRYGPPGPEVPPLHTPQYRYFPQADPQRTPYTPSYEPPAPQRPQLMGSRPLPFNYDNHPQGPHNPLNYSREYGGFRSSADNNFRGSPSDLSRGRGSPERDYNRRTALSGRNGRGPSRGSLTQDYVHGDAYSSRRMRSSPPRRSHSTEQSAATRQYVDDIPVRRFADGSRPPRGGGRFRDDRRRSRSPPRQRGFRERNRHYSRSPRR